MDSALYLRDSYLKEFQATVQSVKDNKFIILNETAFYPSSGGQPHDTGTMICDGTEYPVVYVGKFAGQISHEVSQQGLKEGDKVECRIDWDRRYRLMRMHTAAHIIDAVVYKEAGALCTGNQLGIDKSRIDFNVENIDKEKMKSYVMMSDEIAKKGIGVRTYFMKREEALKIPGIVKLASVMPPDIHELRIVEIPEIDMQADGGTQVKNTAEIGNIEFLGFENRGKSNKRLYYTIN